MFEETRRALSAPRARFPTPEELARVDRLNLTNVFVLSLIQVAAFLAMLQGNGALLLVGVGVGKSLIAMLAGTVLEAKRVVVFEPSNLRDNLERERKKFAGHFDIRPFRVLTYDELSDPRFSEILNEIDPDLIVADEAHKLKDMSRARTIRFLTCIAERPHCRFVALSGTMTQEHPGELSHLSEAAFGDESPIPRRGTELEAWIETIGAKGRPGPIDFQAMRLLEPRLSGTVETKRRDLQAALREHLRHSRGVVLTTDSSANQTIIMPLLDSPKVPEKVLEVIQRCRETHCDPREVPFLDENEELRTVRQLELGFYYWRDFGEVDERLVARWLAYRGIWASTLRREIAIRAAPNYDSPALIAKAAEEGRAPRYVRDALKDWREIEPLVNPITKTTWLDPFMVNASVEWLRELGRPRVLWYRHRAIGEALAAKGIKVFGAGTDAGALKSAENIAASVRSQGEGKNLQLWSYARIVSPMAKGDLWEQTIGRHHRQGQKADEVTIEVVLHSQGARDSFKAALEGAAYIENTTGQRQKLLLANKVRA